MRSCACTLRGLFALPKTLTGEITVTGQVTVNGQTAVSNSTVISGSTIVTGANSSAIVSLGKTGRVEILADSNLVLNFSETSIVGILSSGKARVSNAAGVATTVTTKDATIIADASQANNFLVEVECSHTHVDTTTGIVTMREGTTDNQVAAGTSATAGNLAQTGCKPASVLTRLRRFASVCPGGFSSLPVASLQRRSFSATIRSHCQDDGCNVIVVSPTVRLYSP